MKKLLSICVILLLALTLFVSCDSSISGGGGDNPNVPPKDQWAILDEKEAPLVEALLTTIQKGTYKRTQSGGYKTVATISKGKLKDSDTVSGSLSTYQSETLTLNGELKGIHSYEFKDLVAKFAVAEKLSFLSGTYKYDGNTISCDKIDGNLIYDIWVLQASENATISE